ncbi:hypothetical protein PtB15_5B224 [Puccinia triticina]|nr:hypothetical protein PtB15_5B224 [Puccinia triticina]
MTSPYHPPLTHQNLFWHTQSINILFAKYQSFVSKTQFEQLERDQADPWDIPTQFRMGQLDDAMPGDPAPPSALGSAPSPASHPAPPQADVGA